MTAVLEDIKEFLIDKWGTLNTAASPGKLPEGNSPNCSNVWVDDKPGAVVTSKGFSFLGTLPSGNPATLLINFFKTSDGSSQLVVSDNGTVWVTTDYVNYTSIKTGLAPFFQLRGAVVRDKVWLTNGSDPVMTWDGATLTTLDGNGGTPNVPSGKYIAFHDERIWMYGISNDLSSLRFTALADSAGTAIAPDHASAWPSDNELQISEGDADQGTGIFLYRGYLFCSKQYSIWRITGNDEYDFSRVKTRSSTGTRFQESIQVKDNLVHFIGVDGFYLFDGEDSRRISDPVDPASADEGVFAFRNLQQPLLNTRFWNVSETADFNQGTIPAVLSSADDELTLAPADDTQADFNAGTHSDTTGDDNPGFLQIDLVESGGSSQNLAEGKPATLSGGQTVLGAATFITDGSEVNFAGHGLNTQANLVWQVDMGSAVPIGAIEVSNFYLEVRQQSSGSIGTQAILQYSSDAANWDQATTVTFPGTTLHDGSQTPVFGNDPNRIPSGGSWVSIGESDLTSSFSVVSARYWRLIYTPIGSIAGSVVIRELKLFRAGYESTGTFISKSVDYGSVPATFGTLAASIEANGETYQFFTQSSTDGSTWDALVNVSNGSAIGSSLKRYLRWGVTLNSSTGVNSPVIDKVFVGATYISEIHNTTGNILQWGAFQAEDSNAGQTISYYFRGAATAGAVSAESWTAIVGGAVPNLSTLDEFVQVKIEISTTDAAEVPFVQNFTVNWILSSSSGASVLQNVASIVILNRYYLSAATLGATENDITLILGKSTFQSPWQMKDFGFVSFCSYNGIYIAGSSVDGSLFRLEDGYSKNGEAMDSFYETRDFSSEGFFIKGRELLVTCDRSGPYDLYVGWSTDGGLTYTENTIDLTREDGESLSFTKRLNINFMSDSVRFRVRTNAADEPFSVDEIKLYYRLSPQRGTIEVAA